MTTNQLPEDLDAQAPISRRQLIGGAATLLLAPLAIGAAEASAAAGSSGRISFRITRAGFILGVGGGTGTLTFNGRKYPLSIGGVSLGATIGIASADQHAVLLMPWLRRGGVRKPQQAGTPGLHCRGGRWVESSHVLGIFTEFFCGEAGRLWGTMPRWYFQWTGLCMA